MPPRHKIHRTIDGKRITRSKRLSAMNMRFVNEMRHDYRLNVPCGKVTSVRAVSPFKLQIHALHDRKKRFVDLYF